MRAAIEDMDHPTFVGSAGSRLGSRGLLALLVLGKIKKYATASSLTEAPGKGPHQKPSTSNPESKAKFRTQGVQNSNT